VLTTPCLAGQKGAPARIRAPQRGCASQSCLGRETIELLTRVTLVICLPFVAAQAAAPDPRVDQVDRVISLTEALVKGVEQCFNPSHTKGNTAAKNRLLNLKKTALSAKSSLTSGDAPKLAQSTAELKTQWESFSEKAPFAARFHCDTQRRCMELGFEGHPNYPHCQPVNGNKHANIQYVQFQQSLQYIPKLLDELRT